MKSACKLVQRINAATGVAKKQPLPPGIADAAALGRKAEYYRLLHEALPGVMAVVAELRDGFRGGLVRYVSSESKTLEPAFDSRFVDQLGACADRGGYLDATFMLHGGVHNTIDVATEEWARRLPAGDSLYNRLNALTDDKRQPYGNLATQKRLSSAANQTVVISASFNRFGHQLVQRESGAPPKAERMKTIHANSMDTALQLTDLHLETTRHIRAVLGSMPTAYNNAMHVYADTGYFALEEDTVVPLDRLVVALAERSIDTSDGRYGCPGKQYIPMVWDWLERLEEEHAYGILDRSTSA